MKIRTTLLAAMLAFVGFQASAQTYGAFTLTSVPAIITASTTTNIGAIIDMRGSRHVSFTLAGAGVTNAATQTTMLVAKSVDGVTYESTPSITLLLTTGSSGTTATNLDVDVGAVGFLKVVSLATGANTTTNVSVVCSTKPGS